MLLARSLLAGLAVVVGTLSVGCAADAIEDETAGENAISANELSAKSERSLGQRLPTDAKLDGWYQSVEAMEPALASGDGRYTLEPHRGDGTSAYVQVKLDGKTVGAFLPENSATVLLGEVRAFQLARLLGVPSIVGPGVYFRLQGKGLARFKSIMESERYNDDKEVNRQKIVAKLAANPPSLLGVYKDWSGPKPNDYEALAKWGAPNGVINEQNPFVKLVKAGAPAPTRDLVSLQDVAGGKAPEIDLAKQLSTLLLIDVLNGQWDRFSGGNMHAFVENGVVRFVTLDNGGINARGIGIAADYRNHILKTWVTRYDRDVVKRILALQALATGQTSEALGFTSAEAIRDALMMSETEWKGFKDCLSAAAAVLSTATEASYFP